MTDLYISWADYYQKIETLAVQIYQSGWQFDRIVCIAKGGLRIGDIFCRLFAQPLAIVTAASYGGKNYRQRGEIAFSQHLSMIGTELGKKVLLVDDLVDSGVSLIESLNWLKTNYGEEITEVRTAVIWYKSTSKITPDYYVDYLPNSPWIHQPFGSYEQMTVAELARSHDRRSVDV